MIKNAQGQTFQGRALLGALAAVALTVGGLAASVGDAAAGGMGGGVRDDITAGRMTGGVDGLGRSMGEEIPTLHGGLAGGIGGDSGSIVIPQ